MSFSSPKEVKKAEQGNQGFLGSASPLGLMSTVNKLACGHWPKQECLNNLLILCNTLAPLATTLHFLSAISRVQHILRLSVIKKKQ
jgi:hypothetical protein